MTKTPSRPLRCARLFCALLAISVPLAFVACDDDAGGGSACSVDTDCGVRGQICADAACVEQSCVSRSDCGGLNRACFQGMCTAAECTSDAQCGGSESCIDLVCQDPSNATCSTDTDCSAFGKVCNLITGVCTDPSGCTSDLDCSGGTRCAISTGECVSACADDVDCPAGEYCDAGAGDCVAGCRVGECGSGERCDTADTRTCVPTCTVSACAETDQACDEDSGLCVDRSGAGPCGACATNDECGGPGDRCQPLNGENVCLYRCETIDDCSAGFECTPITNVVSLCVPPGNQCSGCFVDGCAAGEVCNPSDQACAAATDNCSVCEEDWQCGTGSVCLAYQGRTRCLEQCAEDGSCPTEFTCDATSGTCQPDSGFCTQCTLTTADCAAGEVVDEDACECVECVTDLDCTGGDTCAQGVGECVPGNGPCMTSTDCSGAQPCYGALAGERSGQCVECIQDVDCTNGFCDEFTCATCTPPCDPGFDCGPGGICVDPSQCQSDADCMSTRGQTWRCDSNSSLCYDPGTCDPGDPTQAPCPSGMCGGGAFPVPSCSCDVFAQDCRAGESCFPIDFDGNGFCTAQ